MSVKEDVLFSLTDPSLFLVCMKVCTKKTLDSIDTAVIEEQM